VADSNLSSSGNFDEGFIADDSQFLQDDTISSHLYDVEKSESSSANKKDYLTLTEGLMLSEL